MSHELEAIGAASTGALKSKPSSRRRPRLTGPCPNCGAELDDAFCKRCGQSTTPLKRPILSLIGDVFQDTLSIDGRIARTLPALMFRPGHVTRAYLDGKRARYVPPFRLFLLSSVLFFLLLFSVGEQQEWMQGPDVPLSFPSDATVAVDAADLEGMPDNLRELFTEDGVLREEILQELSNEGVNVPQAVEALEALDIDVEDILEDIEIPEIDVETPLQQVFVDRAELMRSASIWTPRLSFLLLPTFAFTLTLLHFWHRSIYVFDHVMVAMHYQCFLYFAGTIAILWAFVSPGWAWGTFGVAAVIYLYRMMRVTYGRGRFVTGLRTFWMLTNVVVAVVLVVVAVALISAQQAGLFDGNIQLEDTLRVP